MIDIGDLCIECRESTAFGSGRFVNRIPADNGEEGGYLCDECAGCAVYVQHKTKHKLWWDPHSEKWVPTDDVSPVCWSDEVDDYPLPEGGMFWYEGN